MKSTSSGTRRLTRIKTERADEGDRTGFQGERYRTEVHGTRAFADAFDDYLGFLAPRLEEARRVLAPHGTLYVHLSEHEGSGLPGKGRGMTLSVADVNSWYEGLKQKGISREREIHTQPWGSRDFIVHDPFDNSIVVTSPAV